MGPIDRHPRPSLDSQYRRRTVGDLRRRCRIAAARWRAGAFERSPIHYDPDDMRGTYDWRRALLGAAVTTIVAVWTARAVVTALLLGPLGADLRTIAAANLLVTVVGLGASVVGTATLGQLVRRERSADRRRPGGPGRR